MRQQEQIESPISGNPLSEEGQYSLNKANKELVDSFGDTFKAFARELIKDRKGIREPGSDEKWTVDYVKSQETGVESAIIKLNGNLQYSTSEQGEVELLKLLDKGEDIYTEFFLRNDDIDDVDGSE